MASERYGNDTRISVLLDPRTIQTLRGDGDSTGESDSKIIAEAIAAFALRVRNGYVPIVGRLYMGPVTEDAIRVGIDIPSTVYGQLMECCRTLELSLSRVIQLALYEIASNAPPAP